ncbi:MAG TPA: 6-carboxytetrahydropterin synthase [Ilumatobacteraceae bacterium]|nr:6-carboxytetrahydropterin synthase [Ilumatobacteraceae bacterium]
MRLTVSAAIHARWGHRVDGLIHTHAWTLEATIEGEPDADKVFPVDDLEALLTTTVEKWHGYYLTHEDVGTWKGLEPLLWDREPTVEEIARRVWTELAPQLAGLTEVAVIESTEFDRSRTVRLSR